VDWLFGLLFNQCCLFLDTSDSRTCILLMKVQFDTQLYFCDNRWRDDWKIQNGGVFVGNVQASFEEGFPTNQE
jgi:hypothetical protein